MDRELVRHLEVLLAKAKAGQVFFYVGSASVLTGKGSADVLAAPFVTPAAAQLDPASRKAVYEKTLEGLAASTELLTGKPITPGVIA